MNEIRTDGCYVMRDGEGVWAYLRFFGPDQVLSISSDQPPAVFARHLVPGNPVFSYGRVQRGAGSVEFTTSNEEGSVSFSVVPIDRNTLAVQSLSHIDGNRFEDVYWYFPS